MSKIQMHLIISMTAVANSAAETKCENVFFKKVLENMGDDILKLIQIRNVKWCILTALWQKAEAKKKVFLNDVEFFYGF